MVIATIPGYPRIGKRRELKRALEGYWSGRHDQTELDVTAAEIRRANWATQRVAGLDLIPVNDFSLYDHVLDTAVLVGAIPDRFDWTGGRVDLDTRFAMARGGLDPDSAPALELTKWFDTNYHYLVPEPMPDQTFRLADDKPFAELAEARSAGIGDRARVALLGPLSFLLLSKPAGNVAPLTLLNRLLPVYREIVAHLAAAGAPWISFDEPCLVQDRRPEELAALTQAYEEIAAAKGQSHVLVQTYFGHVGEAYPTLIDLPIDGIGLDLVRDALDLDLIAQHGFPAEKWLAAGLVEGRNVWVNDLDASLATLRRLTEVISPDRLMVSTSCSLLHVPYDIAQEESLDPERFSRLVRARREPGRQEGDGRVATPPRRGGPRPPRRVAARGRPAVRSVQRASRAPGRAPAPANPADDDDRVVPPDR
jgi:5-methyltetrahydropteroyltriglutamate--homocysteine methyltransferase